MPAGLLRFLRYPDMLEWKACIFIVIIGTILLVAGLSWTEMVLFFLPFFLLLLILEVL